MRWFSGNVSCFQLLLNIIYSARVILNILCYLSDLESCILPVLTQVFVEQLFPLLICNIV